MSLTLFRPQLMGPVIQAADVQRIIDADQNLSVAVAGAIQQYQVLDVHAAMKGLGQAGQLLHLAYAGSKSFKCSVQIVEINANYQRLIKDSTNACAGFMTSSLDALKTYQIACKLAAKGQIKGALEIIGKTAKLAEKMVTICSFLVESADNLCEQSKKALIAAVNEEQGTRERKEELEKTVNEILVSRDVLQQRRTDLEDDYEKQKEEEERLRKKSASLETKAFALSMVSAVMRPAVSMVESVATRTIGIVEKVVGKKEVDSSGTKVLLERMEEILTEKSRIKDELANNEFKLEKKKKELSGATSETRGAIENEIADLEEVISKGKSKLDEKDAVLKNAEAALRKVEENLADQVKHYQEKEDKIAQIRRETRKEMRETNASLAESLSKLQGLNQQSTSLDTAITSLEVTAKTMGRIKTIFENTRLFWLGVQRQCNGLTDNQTMELLADVDAELFIGEIADSGMRWLALARINSMALEEIRSVNLIVDGGMENLPTSAETSKIVENLTKALLQDVNSDQGLLEDGQ